MRLSADDAQLATINQLRERLQWLRDRRIEWLDRRIDELTTQLTPSDGDGWRVDRLLETRLPSSTARQQLLMAAEDFDRQLAEGSDVTPAELPPVRVDWSRIGQRRICAWRRACIRANRGCR